MNILYIGPFKLPDNDAASLRVLSNAKALRYLGHNVDFIGFSPKQQGQRSFKYQEFKMNTIKYPSTIVEWLKYFFCIKNLKKAILTGTYKIVIAYNYPSFSLLRLKRWSKKHNIKIVADITEWYETKSIIKFVDSELRMRVVNKKLDGLICISEYLMNYYSMVQNKIHIPPLVDITESKWNVKGEKSVDYLTLIYSGNPGKHKDKLNLVIESFCLTPIKSKFMVVGLTKEEYLRMYPKHRTLIEANEKNVFFLGRVTNEESIRLVSNSDYHIFLRENKKVNLAGFPTKYVESMSIGTPVITTGIGDVLSYTELNINSFIMQDISIREVNRVIYNISINFNRNSQKIKTNKFDYHNYTEKFQNLFDGIFCKD